MYKSSLAGVNDVGLNVGNNYLYNDIDLRVRDVVDEDEKNVLYEHAKALLVIANDLADSFNLDKENVFVEFSFHGNNIKFSNLVGDEIVYCLNDGLAVAIDVFYNVGGKNDVEYFCGVDGKEPSYKEVQYMNDFKG